VDWAVDQLVGKRPKPGEPPRRHVVLAIGAWRGKGIPLDKIYEAAKARRTYVTARELDEHLTSKRCSRCASLGLSHDVAHVWLPSKSSEKERLERRKAIEEAGDAPQDLCWKVVQCQNGNCGARFHRDHNAGLNLLLLLRRLVQGRGRPPPLQWAGYQNHQGGTPQ
jgi:hypothetical protein